METPNDQNDIIHLDEKLGFITQNQVVLYKNNREEKIDIQSVSKVQLVKKRIFNLNLLLLCGSLIVFYLTYFFYHIHSVFASFLFIGGISIFLYSFYHKYYNYTIVIKEKNKRVHELKGSQVDRESIKVFYFKIAKRANKKRNN
ncbi:MAG: hypothetical protein JNJ52_08710 [Flavobacterium sp.]|nr:hypothetical protein [Flavobacterium sp.]